MKNNNRFIEIGEFIFNLNDILYIKIPKQKSNKEEESKHIKETSVDKICKECGLKSMIIPCTKPCASIINLDPNHYKNFKKEKIPSHLQKVEVSIQLKGYSKATYMFRFEAEKLKQIILERNSPTTLNL